MKSILKTCFLLLSTLCAAYGQATQAAASRDELRYLRFLLMSVASIDHHPNAVKALEDGIARQFGLNSQESASINAAAQELKGLLLQLRQTGRSIAPERSIPSSGAAAALSALATQREQRIEALVNRILNQVRPETAARLRIPGRRLASQARTQGR